MIKSFMPYVDVVFPVSLGPLTYRCPDDMAATAKPGMIVSAPLKNRITRGVIWGAASAPPAGAVKDVAEIHGTSPVLGKGLIGLLHWMADYYLAREGMVLKQTVPGEIFAAKRPARRSGRTAPQPSPIDLTPVPEEDISDIRSALAGKQYRTFLIHADSSAYEYSLAATLLEKGLRNVLIVLPEISGVDMLSRAMKEKFGDRICALHGGLAAGRRSEYVGGIIAGNRDILIGTGLALFAPMPRVSLIMVLHEHSSSYKREEGIRYNIRDMAVMRGYMEGSAVVLTSISPSVDSCFNALTGKYSLIRPPVRAGRPGIRTVDMKFEKKASPGISKTVVDAARSRLSRGRKIMFVINRRGHSTLFLCSECGHTVQCPSCNIPLVLHKKEKILKCHYCGTVRKVPEICEKCGSHRLKLLGYGTQKVQEEIADLLGTEAVRFDSDQVRKNSEIAEILRNIAAGSTKVIVGTRMMTKRLQSGKFALAAIINTDASLNVPDFRASEKACMWLLSIRELVEPGGQVVIQTRFPENPIFRYLREGDYMSFVREELSVRKTLQYPPYSRLLQIIFSGNVTLPVAEEAVGKAGKKVEVLGPVMGKNRKGEPQITFLLKSADKKLLRTAARKIMDFGGAVKGLKLVVDVDPL